MASQMIGAGFEPYPGWRDWLAEQKSCTHARLDALLGYPELRRRYQQKTGYPLNLDAPLTVGDKKTGARSATGTRPSRFWRTR